jgi:beta-N-acetylhexosaminidase
VLDLSAAAARLFTVGFAGKALDADLEALLERGVGGVVLFSRNVGVPAEVCELTSAIKRRAGRPLLVAVDQEGGSVARLRHGFTRLPPFRTLGTRGDAELARELGAVVGRELLAVGIDWDFAPVLDVDTNPANPVIGARSLGAEPARVAELGLAFARGLEDAGVAACGKHFPGHGDTQQDSHRELPRLPHSLERLERIELAPFRAASAAGLPSLMVAHVVFEALDGERPASMSRVVVGELLRGQLGYGGVVVTDDLEMKAIADHFAIEDVVLRGLEAGVDVFLVCHSAALAHRGIDAIVRAVQSGRVPEITLRRALERVERLMTRFARAPISAPALDELDGEHHRSVVARLAGEQP